MLPCAQQEPHLSKTTGVKITAENSSVANIFDSFSISADGDFMA